MRTFLTLLNREIRQLFLTPSLYVVGGVVTLLYSLVFYNHITVTQNAVFIPVGDLFAILSVFLVPVVTMRAFAGETSSGTIELLMTSPVRAWQVVASKFLACYAFYLATLLPCLAYVGVLIAYGDVDSGILYTTLLGLVLIGLSLVAVGLLASAMTDNLIVAAALGIVLNGGMLMLAVPVAEHGASVYSFPSILSFWVHYKEVLSRGMIDTRSMMMLLSLPAGTLSIVWLMVGARGALARAKGKIDRRWRFFAGLLAILAINIAVFAGYAFLDTVGKGGWSGIASLYQGQPAAVDALAMQANRGGIDMTIPQWSFPVAGVLLLLALLALRKSTKPGGGSSGTRDSGMSGRDRWWGRAWPTILGGISILVVLVNINIITGLSYGEKQIKAYRRWDVSEGGVNTLSSSTQAALRELDDTLEITIFLSDRLDYNDVPVKQRLRDLLTEMVSLSPRLKTRYIDALEDKDEARRVADTLGLETTDPVELAKLIVMTYKKKRHVLPAEALVRQPSWKEKSAGMNSPQFRGELPLAITIRRIQDTRVTKIYFSTGFGEMDFDKMDKMPGAIGYFTAALRQEGFVVQEHDFRKTPKVPFDCDVLVLAGPSRPLTAEALTALDQYAINGGRVLTLIPSIRRDGQADDKAFFKLMRSWGGVPRYDVIADATNSRGGSTNILCQVLSNTPIAQAMEQMVVLVPNARSIATDRTRAREHGWLRVDYLMQSLSTSKRFNPKGGGGTDGPDPVAYTAARPGTAKVPESRVVVLGGADALSNLFFEEMHNKLFAVATIHWLSGRHYNVQIRQREYKEFKIRINQPIRRGLFWGLLVALPECWLLLGLLIWWLRKE